MSQKNRYSGTKVRFAANGAALLPTTKISLTDAQCDALAASYIEVNNDELT